jgi:hypothetical protein
MAMAADIRNTPIGGGGKGKGKKSDKKATTIPQSTQPMQQIDIQEIMKVAMAAAASMSNQGYVVDESSEDDDSPPEIFVDATG